MKASTVPGSTRAIPVACRTPNAMATRSPIRSMTWKQRPYWQAPLFAPAAESCASRSRAKVAAKPASLTSSCMSAGSVAKPMRSTALPPFRFFPGPEPVQTPSQPLVQHPAKRQPPPIPLRFPLLPQMAHLWGNTAKVPS